MTGSTWTATGTGLAKASCIAKYTFRPTGRPVVNQIEATFELRDGLIVRHEDAFDFKRWSRQALGAKAYLLGWTSYVKFNVQLNFETSLAKYRNVRQSKPDSAERE